MSEIPNHFVRASLSGVEAKGGDIPKLLDKAGIPLSAYYEQVGWIRSEQYVALVQQVWHYLNDEFFGLTQQRCKPGLFAIMARMSSHHTSLNMVFEEWTNLYSVTREDLTMALTVDNDIATINFKLKQPDLDSMHFLTEFTLITLHRFGSWLTDKHIKLDRVTLTYPKPSHHKFYETLFPCPILFDQPETSLSLDASYLNLPLTRSAEEIRHALKTAPAAFLELPDDDSYVNRTKAILLEFFHQNKRFPNIEETSGRMAVSQRTLRRKLNLEGVSYQEMKDSIRKEIAIEKLKGQNISLEDIAQQLGFSEQYAFSRAFKRWTRLSPGKFRDQTQALNMNNHSQHAIHSIFY